MDSDFIIEPDHTPEWEQQTDTHSCAVVCEMSIINQFGHDLTQEQAAYISSSHGWYMPGQGTSPNDIGNMMDLYNIPNHTVEHATIADLAYELQQGHGVIIGVRAQDLVAPGLLNDMLDSVSSANHAVVVTGIDMNDPAGPQVIINDPGVPDGEGARYPLEQFMDAWENSDFYYAATDNPMPGTDIHALESIDFSKWMKPLSTAGIGLLVGLSGSKSDEAQKEKKQTAKQALVETVFATPRLANKV